MLKSLRRLARAFIAARTCQVAVLFLICFSVSWPANAQRNTQTGFFNPIYEHADPFITYVNGNYYLLTTNFSSIITVAKSPSIAGLASSPAVPVWNATAFESPDMFWDPGTNRWYIYYTYAQNNNTSYVLESDTTDAQGSYHLVNTLCTGCWDVTMMSMPDGSRYLLGSTGEYVWIQQLINPFTPTGPVTKLAYKDQSWEVFCIEAPFPVLHNGKLSIIYSSGYWFGGGYALGRLDYNGKGLLNANSWSKVPGPVFGGSVPNATAYGAGTFSAFPSPDGTEMWFSFNAYRRNDFNDDTREVRVQKMTWNTDNTPNLGTVLPLNTLLPLPAGDPGISAVNGIYPGAWYRVYNQNAGICLDDLGMSTNPGASVDLWSCNGLTGQNWQALPSTTANSYYKFINQQAGLALDDDEGSHSPGANVQLWTDNFTNSERWSMADAGTGNLKVTNLEAGLLLDDFNAGTTSGTNVDLWSNVNRSTQNWLFAPVPQSGLYMKLVNSGSGMCLDDFNWGKTNGYAAIQWSCSGGANQNWQLQTQGNGYYRLVNQYSGLCLDDPGASSVPGVKMQQWSCNGTPAQNWLLVDAGSGYYTVQNQASNLLLDTNGSTTAGTQAQLGTKNGTLAQKWRLVLP
jgi:GH43 family beta-xylosidase